MICIYHADCPDGFGAAWVVNRWARQNEVSVRFIPAAYGDEPPDVAGQEVVIVDFWYPRDVLLEIHRQAKSLIVLDHHDGAREALAGLEFVRVGDQAGCMMAWGHFFYGCEPPLFLEYIQEGDLYRWKLDHSREVYAAICSYRQDFNLWSKWESRGAVYRLAEEGRAIMRERNNQIAKLANGPVVRVEIGGYNVPCVNAPHFLASDLCNLLAVGEPFAASYCDEANHRRFSLRATAASGVHVNQVARLYGGDGHERAAGFTIKKPEILGG
jgi:nanoRNase/pAp phosphatase (c-di-AMP/oligoRNAs hydrolase)